MSGDSVVWGGSDFDSALGQLAETGAIDAQGRRISCEGFERIVEAARRHGDGRPLFGLANFREVTFEGPVNLEQAQFGQEVHFDEATFERRVELRRAVFDRPVHFRKARFAAKAVFAEAAFEREAHFPGAVFEHGAVFRDATFKGFAHFPDVTFGSYAVFVGADLKAGFRLGPTVVAGRLVLDEASLGNADMRLSTPLLCCRRTRFHEPAHLKLRWAEIDLEEGVFDRASTLAFSPRWGAVDETRLPRCHGLQPGSEDATTREAAGEDVAVPRLASLRRADVANLTLASIDLTQCEFESTVRLDALRLATRCPFDEPPKGRRWTRRMTIREERSWRMSSSRWEDWRDEGIERQTATPIPADSPANRSVRRREADRLSKTYRALRTGRENESNAPGAGDFYYGEMEMRRHGESNAVEHAVIWLYWLVSGYGLRASRALVALGVTVLVFATLFSVGIRDETWFDNLVFSLQSTTSLLRAPEEDLPAGGRLLEIGLRLLGPLFFGLALLSLRGRVKR
jgi:uncharacterized protein YjbI with pentapeptide repeats